MSIFEGPKSRKIKELEQEIRKQTYAFNYFLKSEAEKREKLQKKIDELEAIKQPATLADMTKIMGFLIDYSHVVARLGAADPVGIRVEIPEIFAKYNINWTPVKPHGF
jgi:hypothetical protein